MPKQQTKKGIMDGILLVDKPVGPTSFEVVRTVRAASGQRKVGHAGTLDPAASGLLVVCLGQGTKLVPYLMDSSKEYRARVTLGISTDTDDAEGLEIASAPVPAFDRNFIETAAAQFVGLIQQVPPIFSALKRDGEALYRKARRGEQISLDPREIQIDRIDVRDIHAHGFEIDVQCQKGTYIRALARDLAKAMGTEGHLSGLRRSFTSGFSVDQAVSMDQINSLGKEHRLNEITISLVDGLPDLPKLTINDEQTVDIGHGKSIPVTSLGAPVEEIKSDAIVALVSQDGALCAVARLDGDHFQPVRGFSISY
jgi:tRNA pseudouridine55 synthase